MLTTPYSFAYSAETHFPGSFPRLRTGTNAAPSRRAIEGPNRKPLASNPTTTSIFLDCVFGSVWDVRWWIKWVMSVSKAIGSLKRGKMSTKLIPYKLWLSESILGMSAYWLWKIGMESQGRSDVLHVPHRCMLSRVENLPDK
jgi:hypothetical protein